MVAVTNKVNGVAVEILVDKIMANVISKYIEGYACAPSKEQLRSFCILKQFKEILHSTNEYVSLIGGSIKNTPAYIRYYYAVANIKLSINISESIDLLDSVIKDYPRHTSAIKLREIAFANLSKKN